MPNIYQHISENKRDSAFLIVAFVLFFALIGFLIDMVQTEGSGLMYVSIALIFSGFSGLISYYFSDQIVLGVSGATEAPKDEYKDLYNLVENMSIASGIPIPRVYIIQDTSMNAFATGRDPNHAVICFTTGIIDRLEKRELEGVVAHEMSHIGNYDIRLMSLVSILVGSITLIADWISHGSFYRGDRKKSGAALLILLIVAIVGPIIASLIKLALSRHREFLADSTAALITRYPQGLANALKKLSADTEILESANGATAHLFVVSPIRQGFGGAITGLFATHPPIEERIARLEGM